MSEVEQFFKELFRNEKINFNVIKHKTTVTKKINGYFNENTKKLLKQFNDQDFEIYFVVNSGGYKDKDITKINAVFIDLDCKDGNIEQFKQEKLNQLENFKLKPSYVIETKNGLHIYWLVNDNAKLEQFDEAERRLIAYFKADPKVKNRARLMRVPGFYHCKDSNDKFLVKIIKDNKVRYDIADIINALPEVENEERKGVTNININKKNINICDTKNPYLNSGTNIALIKDKNIQALQEIIKPEPVIFYSMQDIYDYLNKQDLALFLGVSGKSFRCVFHDDHNPSAGIVINEETGHQVYHCFASSCGFVGTIIKCTERILGCNKVEALKFLKEVYKIEYRETEYQKYQKEILDENIRYLMSDAFKEEYPETYTRIKNYLLELIVLHEIAKDYVVLNNSDKDNAVFFASLKYITKLCKQRDHRRISDRLALFTYLGLLNKLKLEEIPNNLLEEARRQAEIKKQKYITNYFSIPSYCYKTLTFSEYKAKEFKEKGFTMKGWSREILLRALGEEEADRVYPQMQGKPIPELNEKITEIIESLILALITEKGWTTEKEVLDHIKLKFKGQKQYKEKQLKRCLNEILEKNNLKKFRANKKIKEKINIQTKGYPFIIVREKDLK